MSCKDFAKTFFDRIGISKDLSSFVEGKDDVLSIMNNKDREIIDTKPSWIIMHATQLFYFLNYDQIYALCVNGILSGRSVERDYKKIAKDENQLQKINYIITMGYPRIFMEKLGRYDFSIDYDYIIPKGRYHNNNTFDLEIFSVMDKKIISYTFQTEIEKNNEANIRRLCNYLEIKDHEMLPVEKVIFFIKRYIKYSRSFRLTKEITEKQREDDFYYVFVFSKGNEKYHTAIDIKEACEAYKASKVRLVNLESHMKIPMIVDQKYVSKLSNVNTGLNIILNPS